MTRWRYPESWIRTFCYRFGKYVEEAVKGITSIDLSRVSRVDTGGLALLLHLIDLAKKQGNNVTLQGVNDKVYTLAKLYNLPADVLPR